MDKTIELKVFSGGGEVIRRRYAQPREGTITAREFGNRMLVTHVTIDGEGNKKYDTLADVPAHRAVVEYTYHA